MCSEQLRSQKIHNIEKLMLTKVERNGLIGATRYYYILAISDEPANELVGPDTGDQ
jgi:hypothetical protein